MAPFSGEEPQARSPAFRPDARAQARELLAVRVLPKQTRVLPLACAGHRAALGVGQGLPVGRPGWRLILACGLPASPLAPRRILVLCFELGS